MNCFKVPGSCLKVQGVMLDVDHEPTLVTSSNTVAGQVAKADQARD